MTDKTKFSERLALNVDIAKAHGWHVEHHSGVHYMHGPNHVEYWTAAHNQGDAWIECVSGNTVPDWTRDLNLAWTLLVEMNDAHDVEINVKVIQFWFDGSYAYRSIESLNAESTAYAICRVWQILNEE